MRLKREEKHQSRSAILFKQNQCYLVWRTDYGKYSLNDCHAQNVLHLNHYYFNLNPIVGFYRNDQPKDLLFPTVIK